VRFEKYNDVVSFGNDTLEILLENEVQNNLPIGFILNERGYDTSKWLLASIKDDTGGVVLTAACTPPFNIVMYETRNQPNNAAVKLLSDELKGMGHPLPGVLAEQGLAQRFAEIFAGNGRFHRHLAEIIMRLDMVNEITKAPGRCRPLCENDLFFVPYWERSFGEECQVEVYDIPTNVKRAEKRIGKDIHFIWEDGRPVSQTYNERNTQNGSGISGVYTPPHYRGRGYASSVVAELSQSLLERGSKFCFLFADAANPISCGIYRKLGYYDLCVFDEIKFD
jgi:GNAT superfamily N-acetyltransferase